MILGFVAAISCASADAPMAATMVKIDKKLFFMVRFSSGPDHWIGFG